MHRRNGDRYKKFFVVAFIVAFCFLAGNVIGGNQNAELDAFTDSIYWIGERNESN